MFERERGKRANGANTQSRLDASPISDDAERYGRSGKFLFCDSAKAITAKPETAVHSFTMTEKALTKAPL